ncbi:hypothetical protein K2173_000235 [Erythroxylum novogranatense]|uniref:Metallo-beta-lactamase domain-containing protein n=1 Tax=Erythroxylum novogranatense TaxID=1862640 RepID=A0AAV8SWV6_9ROSI|nr:hypothetical protein K2173_000235 [Erythroxylum novogranatense]
MATCNLALIIRDGAKFILLKQNPPPKFGEEEYDSCVDSDLWDLPSTKLNPSDEKLELGVVVEDWDSSLEKIDLRKFDIMSALSMVLGQVGYNVHECGNWSFLKLVEEAEFGPGLPLRTVFLTGNLMSRNQNLPEQCKWMSVQNCLSWLLHVKSGSERVGPFVVAGLENDWQTSDKKVNTTLHYQEYPPGVVVVPMKSRTQKPFHTTNLVIFAPENISKIDDNHSFVAFGDALVVDPGCRSDSYEELFNIVSALPRKLIVFATHHHLDHIEGLSIIQKCNPEATLLAHENTMRYISKGQWSLGRTTIYGGEDICIGGQRLNVIYAPGHTNGHLGLFHVSTHSLIVGDHCVGQGSALLDIDSGGNMNDYFQSTYKFIELSPHVLIPMHGRINLWPKHMLCGYLMHRRSREMSILKAIESGAKTLFEIVASVYSEVDRSLWFHASSNVRLHVEHLAIQNKLPREFSIQKFHRTCGLHFLSRWTLSYITRELLSFNNSLLPGALAAGAVASFAVLCWVRSWLSGY